MILLHSVTLRNSFNAHDRYMQMTTRLRNLLRNEILLNPFSRVTKFQISNNDDIAVVHLLVS